MAGSRPPVGSILYFTLDSPTGHVWVGRGREGNERSCIKSVTGTNQERARRSSRGRCNAEIAGLSAAMFSLNVIPPVSIQVLAAERVCIATMNSVEKQGGG